MIANAIEDNSDRDVEKRRGNMVSEKRVERLQP